MLRGFHFAILCVNSTFSLNLIIKLNYIYLLFLHQSAAQSKPKYIEFFFSLLGQKLEAINHQDELLHMYYT